MLLGTGRDLAVTLMRWPAGTWSSVTRDAGLRYHWRQKRSSPEMMEYYMAQKWG